MPDVLISEITEKLYQGEYKELHIDSRKVRKGDLFLAFPVQTLMATVLSKLS